MKAQQAPTGCPTMSARQALRSVPLHTASTKRNWIVGGRNVSSSAATATVSAMLAGDENRFARAQASGPRIAAGGRAGATISVRTKDGAFVATAQRSTSAMRRLYSFMTAEVTRLMRR